MTNADPNPATHDCPSGKRGYGNRLAADSALQVARLQWRRRPVQDRRPGGGQDPPIRIYRCEGCSRWHLTSKPLKA